MTYTVQLTETAKQDLREIVFQLAECSKDKELAKRFVNGILEECRKLDQFPNAGAVPKDRVLCSAGYRFVVYKDYLVFYLVDEEAKLVTIMAVFNGKRDYMRVMRKYI